ncbi:MAG: hypothetical protein WCR72_04360 [Bacteroidota bacterium]
MAVEQAPVLFFCIVPQSSGKAAFCFQLGPSCLVKDAKWIGKAAPKSGISNLKAGKNRLRALNAKQKGPKQADLAPASTEYGIGIEAFSSAMAEISSYDRASLSEARAFCSGSVTLCPKAGAFCPKAGALITKPSPFIPWQSRMFGKNYMLSHWGSVAIISPEKEIELL